MALVLALPSLCSGQLALGADTGPVPAEVEAPLDDDSADDTTPKPEALGGPEAPRNRIKDDQKPKQNLLDTHLLWEWDAWKSSVYDRIGLQYGVDYNALGSIPTESLGDIGAAGGVVRLYGHWDFFGRGTNDTSGLIYKIEQRHRYADTAPAAFAPELGYAGVVAQSFSNQGFRVTHLHWRQSLLDQRLIVYAGFLDVTDYVDVFPLASPWTAFANIAFSNGSGTIGGLPDGSLGFTIGGFLTEHLYAVFGLADANGDPTDIGSGFGTFFTDFETFKSFELGWTSGRDRLFADNVHVTFWQVDERTDAGVPGGWGVSFSVTAGVGESWLPFLRGGWAKDGGSLYEGSVTAGLAYQRSGTDDQLGVGVNWSLPNDDTFGANLGSQFTAEIFYRLQVTQRLQITPSMQLIGNPAQNPESSFVAVFGLRARVAI